jgi:serine/threonine protein kinase
VNPERWKQIEELYHAAREQSREDRAAFVERGCVGDDDLRKEVESLLARDAQVAGPVDRLAWDGMGALLESSIDAPISVGTDLGAYRVTGTLGAGGMGHVYRAEDSRLGRSVAIKISRDRFSDRFEREARAVAALNHPNICTLYDVGPNYLVMELVEGPTLADRIKKGPMPLPEALNIARQIAGALEAAHEAGIVHRDLKPANIKVKPDGTVKVLDFGLAKVARSMLGAGDSTPLVGDSVSRAGVILGTAAYMAPEQARGEAVDKRADIWAFGVVLYEMLTGKRLFQGETAQLSLLQVMKKDIDWTRLPAIVQPLLRQCLERDPKRRLRDIGDVPALLAAAETAPLARRRLPWGAWATLSMIVAAMVLGFLWFRTAPSPPGDEVQFRVPLAPGVRPTKSGTFSLSPDGRSIAYVGTGTDGIDRLWVQPLKSLEAKLLPETEMPVGNTPPIWSPDAKSIAFYSRLQLKRTDPMGSTPRVICDVPTNVVGGSWNHDDVIIFGSDTGGLMKVNAAGGPPSPVTKIDPSRQERNHVFPTFLPDGRHFIYTRTSPVGQYNGVFLGSLDDPPDTKPPEPLLRIPLAARFVLQRSGGGKLFFILNDVLMAQDFDLSRFQLTGEPEPVIPEKVGFFRAFGFFDATADVLAYRAAPAEDLSQLSWVDREGKLSSTIGNPISLSSSPAISPQGDRAVAAIFERHTSDLWLIDLERGLSQRLTSDFRSADDPAWSADGSEIVFTSRWPGKYDVYRIPSNGEASETLIYESADSKFEPSWSPDSRFLLFTSRGIGTELALWSLPSSRLPNAQPIMFSEQGASAESGTFSPDGRWVAYVSHESGAAEVFVRSFAFPPAQGRAGLGSPIKVAANDGRRPRWRADGKELFYQAADGSLMAFPVTIGASFERGPARVLFRTPSRRWDAAPDGKRFLVAAPVTQGDPGPFTVVLNWGNGSKK